MSRRRALIRLRNRLQFLVGLPVDALLAAWRACNPNTWRVK